MNFPVLVDEITPAWLSHVLGGTVDEVTAAPVGTGQIANCYRLSLTGSAVPAHLIVKLPHVDPAFRAFVAGAYRTEARFYRDIARTVAVRVPACQHVEYAESGDFVLLLEDLAPAEQGDQIDGCDVEQARDAVLNLAGLHGPRWCDPTLTQDTGLTPVTDEEVGGLVDVFGPATEQFVTDIGPRLTEGDIEILRAVPDLVATWILARPERFALVHGDYRLDNLLFPPDGAAGSVAVDWQTLTLGLPARDLAYFVATSLDPDVRRTHERELVSAYHSALPAEVTAGFTLEACWDDYAFAMVQAPLTAVLGQVYGTRTERGDAMFAAMVSRACAAMRDLDTLGRIS